MANYFKSELDLNPLSIVVLGASGDLAKKKIFPSLFLNFCGGFFSKDTEIVGYARSDMTSVQLCERVRPFLKSDDEEKISTFFKMISYVSGSYDNESGFDRLNAHLNTYEEKFAHNVDGQGAPNRMFYLALPPSVYPPVLTMLKACCMGKSGGWNRVVVEKPFGKDLESALQLSDHIGGLFNESEIYRMDHYLGKEMVQNLLVCRFANQFTSAVWNRDNIKLVQITFKEPFGVEGRGGYFDKSGIIRDILQNHLMQLLSLVAMEKPISLQPEDIRDEKVKVLRCMSPASLEECVLGQYVAANGKPGYLDDDGVPKDSNCPTFASLALHINNERWEGVPFILKAGKALDGRKAEIRIQFHNVAGDIFPNNPPNELVLRVQPDEAMYMKMSVKAPGFAIHHEQAELDFTYGERYEDIVLPDAYERLLLDVIRGDRQSFVRRDELEYAWRVFDPLLKRIEEEHVQPLKYPYGSRGPPEADDFAAKYGFVRNHNYVYRPGPRRDS